MDVSKIGNLSRLTRGFAQYATQAKNTANSKTTAQNKQSGQAQTDSAKIGGAFELDISNAAKQAQQTNKPDGAFVEDDDQQQSKGLNADQVKALQEELKGTEETKGLATEQVDKLKENIEMQESTMLNIMIQAMTDSNNKLQEWADNGIGFLNFGGTQIEASLFGLPEVATNAEDAAKAIAPGGDWSVDAVSSRIFDLATAIAGNDPERLAEMRAAVEEGFKQAGAAWKDATG
ncbi:MAG: hypothetical protein IKT98_00940 [Selenomonadaceae bacterium]|nr:hypothetical protein [Selenomonadaceae bacterium]